MLADARSFTSAHSLRSSHLDLGFGVGGGRVAFLFLAPTYWEKRDVEVMEERASWRATHPTNKCAAAACGCVAYLYLLSKDTLAQPTLLALPPCTALAPTRTLHSYFRCHLFNALGNCCSFYTINTFIVSYSSRCVKCSLFSSMVQHP